MLERSYLGQYQPSLEDLKRHLRITSSDLDSTLEPYLLAAIEAAEKHIGRIIAASEFCYSGWFVRSFEMKGPVRKLVRVEVDGVELTPDEYTVDRNNILLSQEIKGEEVLVSYQAGMTSVPFDINAAILLTAAKLFNNPVDSVESLPSVAKNLLRPYRTWGIGNGIDL
jgi:hypothetical protein